MEDDRRTGFTFYRSYYEQLQIITEPMQRLAMYDALANYALNHIKPDLKSGDYNELQKMFWAGVLPLLDKSWSKFLGGSEGGAPKGNTNASKNKTTKKQPKNNQKQPATSKDVYLYNDVYRDDNKDNYIEGESAFRPPSLEDVLSYYSSIHGTEVESSIAKKFINYYAARGWKMGTVMMTDWRAAFNSWCDKETEFNHKNTHNDEDDSTTSEQRSAELEQLRSEQRAAEARIAGEVRGA